MHCIVKLKIKPTGPEKPGGWEDGGHNRSNYQENNNMQMEFWPTKWGQPQETNRETSPVQRTMLCTQMTPLVPYSKDTLLLCFRSFFLCLTSFASLSLLLRTSETLLKCSFASCFYKVLYKISDSTLITKRIDIVKYSRYEICMLRVATTGKHGQHEFAGGWSFSLLQSGFI
jgi:hypothetical protein